MVSMVETDILSTPDVWQQALATLSQRGSDLTQLIGPPLVLLGSGSSYDIGVAAATLYEESVQAPAQAILPSEYLPRPGWSHIAISRTGQTTELIEAMQRAREAGAPVGLIVGDPDSPAERQADVVFSLPFAPEAGVIQTRFISAALLVLRALLQPSQLLPELPERLQRHLAEFDAQPLSAFRHLVFLGRHWRYGLALSAALTMQETALLPASGFQTLDYRHGPIATASAETLVWGFDPADDAMAAQVLAEAAQTGATVHAAAVDPLLELVAAQLLAVWIAAAQGVNPDEPRHLSRAVVLAGSTDYQPFEGGASQ